MLYFLLRQRVRDRVALLIKLFIMTHNICINYTIVICLHYIVLYKKLTYLTMFAINNTILLSFFAPKSFYANIFAPKYNFLRKYFFRM